MRKLISLYTGIGGMDFGFEAAGFETAVAVELDRAACRNLRANRSWPVIEGDIHRASSQEILDTAGLNVGEVDLLIGGPPCQPFSKSGYWANGDSRRLDDPRSDTIDAYLRVLRDTLPRAFVLENVPGLAYKGKAEALERILALLKEINRQKGVRYRASWKIVNAADYGAPQMRERIVIIGCREGRGFLFPEPTHGGVEQPHHTAWDALGDLPEAPNEPGLEMSGKWADLLPTIPEGQNYLFHTDRGDGEALFGWRRRYWSFLLKLAKDRPSWTIQAQPGSATGPFHWNNRRLSSRELSRLQTFPDDVSIEGSRQDIQRLVGNAVPSVLAEMLGREIEVQLWGGKRRPEALVLEPPYREGTPKAARPKPLPAKFLSLIGEHEAHPGEGLGYAAQRRKVA